MPQRGEPDRVLATILFTDIVGSTELAAKVGDHRWHELLRAHHGVVRRDLKRFGGRELDTAGDGFLAIFESPGNAIGAAASIVEDVTPLGLQVRTGLHMGECTVMDGKVEGITVHIGARVTSLAEGGEVLVSSTVRDALAGSGFTFDDRGMRSLKGVPREWRIFAVVHPEEAARRPLTPYHGQFGGARKRRTPRTVVVGVAIALVATLLVATVLSRASHDTRYSAISANAVGRIDPNDGSIVADIPSQGNQPVALAYLGGAVWVANALSRTVTRIDTDSQAVATSIATDGPPVGIAAGFGSVWVLESSGEVERIDGASDQVTTTIAVPSDSHAIATGAGAVWVANSALGSVTQINPSTGQRVNTIPVGEGGTSESPGALAAAGSSVWVIDELSSTLWRIDTGTQRQAGSVSLQGRPSGIAIASDGGVWVSMATSNLVARVDPETGQSVTIDVTGMPTALTIGEGAVWVASFGGDQVSKIDLSTRDVVASIPVGAVPSAVVVGAGSVWVAAAPN